VKYQENTLEVAAGQAPEGSKSLRVLLCDDMQQVRLVLRTEMSLESDLEVVGEATNGLEAIELARKSQPDVVILDLTMPVMDGLEALPRIREAAPSARVIMLSAHGTSDMKAKAVAAGASRYIEKTATTREIVDAVRARL
jgi:DNA-binding NarL/FixJ family response regulator